MTPTAEGKIASDHDPRIDGVLADLTNIGMNVLPVGGTAKGIGAGLAGLLKGMALPPGGRRLPMDQASRMARAKQLGYGEESFWRGEATGRIPDEYPIGAYFSRDQNYATAFARRGGQREAREFRLDLSRALKDHEELTAAQYARLVAAVPERKLAAGMVDQVAPGTSIEWFREFAKRNPDFEMTRGTTPLVRHTIESQTADPVGVFTRAGFDALDSGRDVRKLTGHGIRLKTAAFDPARRRSPNINYFLVGGAVPPMLMALDPSRD